MNILYYDGPLNYQFSVKMFKFLAEHLNFDYVVGSKDVTPELMDLVATPGAVDCFMLVNSSPAFMKQNCREFVAMGCYNSKHPIFAQNDYTILPPSQCKSFPLKEYCDCRGECNQVYGFDLWTTCPDHNFNLKPEQREFYVDWNKLAKKREAEPLQPVDNTFTSLLYYGSFRNGRRDKFAKFLNSLEYEVDIYAVNKNQIKKFQDLLGDFNINYHEKITPEIMRLYRASMMMQDDRSTRNYHSMPTRFYECLDAGIGMIFDPDFSFTLDRAGITGYEPYIAHSEQHIAELLDRPLAEEQRELWLRDYREDVLAQLRVAVSAYPELQIKE